MTAAEMNANKIDNQVGYVWYWDHAEPFFINHSYRQKKSEAYKWAKDEYERIFGSSGLAKARKKGLKIMRVRFEFDGWQR